MTIICICIHKQSQKQACKANIFTVREQSLLKLNTASNTLIHTILHNLLHTGLHTVMHTVFNTSLHTVLDTTLHTVLDTTLHTGLDTTLHTVLDTALHTVLDTAINFQRSCEKGYHDGLFMIDLLQLNSPLTMLLIHISHWFAEFNYLNSHHPNLIILTHIIQI